MKGGRRQRTKEEVGRQHPGMDRPGVRQVPEGSGEQGKMETTGCKIIYGAPTTLAVKGLMMMMTRACHFVVVVDRENLSKGNPLWPPCLTDLKKHFFVPQFYVPAFLRGLCPDMFYL